MFLADREGAKKADTQCLVNIVDGTRSNNLWGGNTGGDKPREYYGILSAHVGRHRRIGGGMGRGRNLISRGYWEGMVVVG